MMRNKTVLVIGAAGFVGPYLVKNLRKYGYKVIPTKLKSQSCEDNSFVNLDILNLDDVKNCLNKNEPNYIVNLAAQSSVSLSWEKPLETFKINVIGVMNVLESIRILKLKCRLLLIGTSDQYGKQNKMPLKESTPCKPNNFYSLSKLTQEKIAHMYINSYNLDIVLTRSFNHIGVGQSKGFVTPDFCSQLIKIEKGEQKPIIKVGNLNAKRDFSNVEDIVDGYRLILEKGRTGEIYNIGSGKPISIKNLLDIVISNSNKPIKIQIDKNKFRPIDTPLFYADVSKAEKDLGYKTKNNLDETIKNIINYMRN